MSSHNATSLIRSDISPASSSFDAEQLKLPLNAKDDGLLPLRLLEPITSLNLTPFAAKAVRSTGATSIGELANLVFDTTKECRTLGQGHLDEVRRKIENFVGAPPYQREQRLDMASLLRLSLSEVDSSERNVLVTFFSLQQVHPLTPQEAREAETTLLKDKERKLQEIIGKAALKAAEKTQFLLTLISRGLLEPWLLQRGGVAHEREIILFIFEQGSVPQYDLFERCLRLLLILTEQEFLFSEQLCHVTGKIWAASSQEKKQAEAVLRDAETLIGKKAVKATCLNDLAKAVEECRFGEWDTCSSSQIKRLLFWHYHEG